MTDETTDPGDGSDRATDVESTETFENLLATEQTVLVDFYAEWCGPCQMMADTIDELAAESGATVAKVNVEEAPRIAAQYDVQSIPTFVVFDDRAPTARLVGMQDKSALRTAIR
ncbi:MAG: thioredoxin [Halapricum sp.]